MATVTRSKLAAKDMGDPKAALGTKDKVLLGTILGYADQVSIRKDPTGEKSYKGLSGSFEGVSADKTRDTIQAGICYLPGGMDAPIIAALEELDASGKRKTASVEFAVEIYVIKATNPQGYSWESKAAIPVTKSADVLEGVRQKLLAGPSKSK